MSSATATASATAASCAINNQSASSSSSAAGTTTLGQQDSYRIEDRQLTFEHVVAMENDCREDLCVDQNHVTSNNALLNTDSLCMSCCAASASPASHSTPLSSMPTNSDSSIGLSLAMSCHGSPIKGSTPSVVLSEMPGSHRPIPLTLKYDMGWQRRSSRRAYNRLSGIDSMIGHKTGKIVGYGVRCKSCRVCSYAKGRTKIPNKHDCIINFTGSSKAMAYSRNNDNGVRLLFGEKDVNNFLRITSSKQTINSVNKFLSET